MTSARPRRIRTARSWSKHIAGSSRHKWPIFMGGGESGQANGQTTGLMSGFRHAFGFKRPEPPRGTSSGRRTHRTSLLTRLRRTPACNRARATQEEARNLTAGGGVPLDERRLPPALRGRAGEQRHAWPFVARWGRGAWRPCHRRRSQSGPKHYSICRQRLMRRPVPQQLAQRLAWWLGKRSQKPRPAARCKRFGSAGLLTWCSLGFGWLATPCRLCVGWGRGGC